MSTAVGVFGSASHGPRFPWNRVPGFGKGRLGGVRRRGRRSASARRRDRELVLVGAALYADRVPRRLLIARGVERGVEMVPAPAIAIALDLANLS